MARPIDTRVQLRKPLERSIRAGHPWVYRDALAAFDALPGTIVSVHSKSGRFLARGLAEAGAIGVRVFTTKDEPLDAEFFARRTLRALDLRMRIVPGATNTYRLIHGEGDRLPGIVCDRYDAFAVLKFDGEAALAWQDRMCEWLRAPLLALGIRGLLVRGPRRNRQPVTLAWGEAPPDEVLVEEHGMQLWANLWQGQKTGLFLDHRESRQRARAMASGQRVLNLYGYTGGFSVAAGLGGAIHVTTVDSARAAIELAERSWQANGLPAAGHLGQVSDVPAQLACLARSDQRFGLIVADPPSFAPNHAALPAALESYSALHAAALGLIETSGSYLAASCSSHVTRAAFEGTLHEGSRRARRALQVLERWEAPADHPRLLAFPEGEYLKVALLRVT